MSFPTSPTNGQTAVINNITYQYSSSSNSWTRLAGQVTSTNTLNVYGNINATSTTSGALQVIGGVGVGQNLYVGGMIYGTLANASSTATNIAGGTAGQLVYQTAPGVTSFTGPGTLGQILVSQGTSAPLYVNTSSIQVGSACLANNISGGAAGSIHYQSAANVTTFLSLSGTAGSLLVAGASAPQYATNVQATSGTGSQTTASGQSLVVTSGGLGVKGASFFDSNLGVGGSLYITGDLYVDGSQTIVNKSSIATGDQAIVLSTGSTSAALAQGAGLIIGQSTSSQYISLTYDGSANWVSSGGIKVSSTASTVSTTTGALTIAGGVGISGGLFVGGTITATNFSGSFSGNMSGTAAYANTASFAGTATNLAGGATGSIPYQTAAGQTAFIGAGTQGSILQMGATTASFVTTSTLNVGYASQANNIVGGVANQIPYQTAAGATGFNAGLTFNGTVLTATNVSVSGTAGAGAANGGALTVAGGVGVAGDVFVGGTVTATTFVGTFKGVITTATNVAGGLAGQLVYQTAPGVTGFLSTSSLTVGSANTASNIAGGTVGQLVYQTGCGTTGFAGPGTSGQILVSQGASAPLYTNTSSIQVGLAAKAANICGGTAGQIPYQTAPGVTSFVAVTGTSCGVLTSAGTGTPTYKNTIKLSGSCNANSTITGAFQVVGGAGIGGNLFVGGSAYLSGDLYVDGTQFVVNRQTIASGDSTLLLSTGSTTALAALGAGLQIGQSTSTAYITWTFDGINSWQSSGGIKVLSTAGTTSAVTGAVQIAGGVGIAGSLYVGGTITATNFSGNISGTAAYATTATNVAGGLAGQVLYQTAPGLTGFISTGSLQVGFANAVMGGAAGNLTYQTAANATGFVTNGTTNQHLIFNGTAPTWVSTGTFSGGTASSSTVANQSVTVTGGGVGVTGDSYFASNLVIAGTVTGGGIRTTTTSTAPSNPSVGDIWYNTTTDDIYRYTQDGSSTFWLDITGPAVANASPAYVSIATLKSIVAASTSFTDFQSRIASM